MILIDDRQVKVDISDSLVKSIKEVIDLALKHEKLLLDYEVSIIFVDNKEI